jgi:hypothetical protein
MKKALFLSISLLVLAGSVIAQTATSCQPASCGPEGTKTEEAAVITKLRTDVLALQHDIQSKKLKVEVEMATSEELRKPSDGESLLVLGSQLWQLHTALSNAIPADMVQEDFNKLKFNLRDSGAQLVSNLNQNLNVMKKQLDSLRL